MIDFLRAVIRPTYWFTHQHPVPDAWQTGLTFFFGALIVLGIVAMVLSGRRAFRKPFRTLFGRLAAFASTMGVIGLVLLFFSVQRISFLSARIFYLLWFALFIVWAYSIVKYAVKDIPRLIEGQEERALREKYLPKKKA